MTSQHKRAKYAPVPIDYICKSCGAIGNHWIMNCQSTNNNTDGNKASIPFGLKHDKFNDKSSKWHHARCKEYQLIYDSIKSSNYCNDDKMQASIGNIPNGIIAQISLYTVSCCDILNCDCCKSEINSYLFERKHHQSNKEILDYYLSDDYEENNKIFCYYQEKMIC